MSNSQVNIELNPDEVIQSFNVLMDLKDVNQGTPFFPHCLRLLYQLEKEIKYLQSLKESEQEEIKEQRVDIGFKKVPSPEFYPDGYEKILGLLCDGVKVKESKFAKLKK
jgi:hypothetical protein